MKKAKSGGFTFGEPRDEDVEKLYQLQKDNFDSYTVSLFQHHSFLRGDDTNPIGMA